MSRINANSRSSLWEFALAASVSNTPGKIAWLATGGLSGAQDKNQ